MSDSTNAEVPGFVTPEREIGPVLDDVFRQATARIIVACFASHVHRVQQVLDAAEAHGRKVAFIGRSMVRNMGIARDLGYLTIPPGPDRRDQPARRPAARSRSCSSRPARRASRCRRCRGWPTATTSRSASSPRTPSSSPPRSIPGNESAVWRVVNGLTRWGAKVVHKERRWCTSPDTRRPGSCSTCST